MSRDGIVPGLVPDTVTVMSQKQALRATRLENLAVVASKVGDFERTTEHHAGLVQHIAECILAGCKRKDIAEALSKGTGNIARPLMLARWELGLYSKKKGEVPLEKPITLVGQEFMKPVEALKANRATFRQVFETFANAIRPARAQKIASPDGTKASTEAPSDGASVTTTTASHDPVAVSKTILKKSKVAETPETFLAMFMTMLEDPMAGEVLGNKRAAAWLKMVKQDVYHGTHAKALR